MVVFGDSLSDTGNRGRYMFDNDKNYIYSEILSQRLGITLKPSSQGGFNYAAGGAVASPTLRQDFHTQDQVSSYINRVQGRADSNTLYIHWIGANDLIRILLDPAYKQNQETMVNESAQLAASQINKLIQAGAGTIIAPTIPNIGLTPLLAEKVIRFQLNDKDIQNTAVQAAYNILNNVVPSDATSRQQIIHQAIAAAGVQASTDVEEQKTITAQLITTYDTLSKRAEQLVNLYNTQIDQRIAQNGAHIVRADINRLFTELLTDSTQYGLINTTGTSCPITVYAHRCTSEMTGFDNTQTYLFADNTHTSPQVHFIIADYLKALLDGPVQVTTLNQATAAMARDVRSTLDSRFEQLRNTSHTPGTFGMFGGYTRQHDSETGGENKERITTRNVTAGADYQLTKKWSVGALLSRSGDKQHPSSDYEYQYQGLLFSLFSTVDITSKGWINADLHFINMAYNNIRRQIKMGPATHTEQGNTHGKQWGARLTAGWDIPLTINVTTGPVIQYALDYSKIYGYSENSDSSTAMHFSNQIYHSKIAGAGWRLNMDFGVIKPYAQIDWQHQFGDDVWPIAGGLKSSQTTFTSTSARQEKKWKNFTLGASIPLGTHAAVFARISQTAGLSRGERLMYNLGGSLSF